MSAVSRLLQREPTLEDFEGMPEPDPALLTPELLGEHGSATHAALALIRQSPAWEEIENSRVAASANRGTHVVDPMQLALQWANAAQELQRAGIVGRLPLVAAGPAPGDSAMETKIGAAEDAVRECERQLADAKAKAKAGAAEVAARIRARAQSAEVESAKGRHHSLIQAVESAQGVLEAAREELQRVHGQAADPKRRKLLQEYERELDASDAEHFVAACAADADRVEGLAAELMVLLRRMQDRSSDAQQAMGRARRLADELELPRPRQTVPEAGDARRLYRRALHRGVIAAGVSPADLRMCWDVWSLVD